MKKLSGLTIVLTPVFNDLESLKILVNKISSDRNRIHFLIIDDCSTEDSITYSTVPLESCSGEIINLEKNLGHQGAISYGLNYINSNYSEYLNVVVMDSDGEDKPESIIELNNEIQQKGLDLVVASRRSRKNSFQFKLFYFLYKLIFFYFTGSKLDFGNFIILNNKALIKLVKIKNLNIHLAASVLSSSINYGSIKLDRGARYKGESKMNFIGLFLHGMRSLVVLEDRVFKRGVFILTILFIPVIFSPYKAISFTIFSLHVALYLFLIFYRTKLTAE